MEVKKHGEASKRVATLRETMKVTCETCAAELEICPDDLDSKGGIIRKVRYYFVCTECHKTTYLFPEKLVPSFRRCVDEEIANKRFWKD